MRVNNEINGDEGAIAPDANLSPDVSPKIMEVKTKRARRINNRPMFVVFLLIGIIALTQGLVMINRSSREKADIGKNIKRSADAYAKEVTSMDSGGVVTPAPKVEMSSNQHPPQAESSPASPPDFADKPPALAKIRPARLSEEMRKVMEKRWRQTEAAAIDAPIKVDLGDMKSRQQNISADVATLERQLASLTNNGSTDYGERLAGMQGTTGNGGGADYSRRDDLSRMNQFGSGTTNWQNPASVESPSSMHIIRTGSVIPATLISGINSDLPGQIVAQVAQDVYDTPTGKYLLLPQGSRLIGEYSSDVQYGQSRIFAVWQRVIFPDGKALDLGAMPGSSSAGYSGFRDRVNNHYLRVFGSAIMMSGIVAGVSMSQDDDSTGNKQRMSDALSEALGQQLGGVMSEMLQKNMNIAPTLEIRPGYRFNVMLVKDLVFNGPYSGFDYVRR